MIGNRSQGLRLISHTTVVLFMLLLFSALLLYSVHILGRIDANQVNFPLYFLGVFVAGLLSYSYREQEVRDADLNSFLWVASIRKANYQVVILLLVLFGIIFTTKDKAISRIFIGSFILTAWVSLIAFNRYVPAWIARLAFEGENSVRTVFLGSAKSARRLEQWAYRQPFYGVDILGLITYKMATDLELKMPIIGEFMDMALIMDAYKVDQVVLLETRNSDWWVDSVVELCEKSGCRMLIFTHGKSASTRN